MKTFSIEIVLDERCFSLTLLFAADYTVIASQDNVSELRKALQRVYPTHVTTLLY
ncbi:MAG: hypothetical protein ACRDCS_01195 [Tannerellaceae bacterium]